MMMRDVKAVKKEMKEDNKKEKKQSKKEKKAKEAEARNWLETALAEAEEAEYALEAAARTRVEPRHAGQNGSMSSEILRIHHRLRGKQYVKDAIPVVSCSTFDQCLSTAKDGTSQSLWFCVGCGAAVSKDLLGISEHEKLCVKFRLCNEAQVLFLASQQQLISKRGYQKPVSTFI